MESPVITLHRGGSKRKLVVMRRWVGVGHWESEGEWVSGKVSERVSR